MRFHTQQLCNRKRNMLLPVIQLNSNFHYNIPRRKTFLLSTKQSFPLGFPQLCNRMSDGAQLNTRPPGHKTINFLAQRGKSEIWISGARQQNKWLTTFPSSAFLVRDMTEVCFPRENSCSTNPRNKTLFRCEETLIFIFNLMENICFGFVQLKPIEESLNCCLNIWQQTPQLRSGIFAC